MDIREGDILVALGKDYPIKSCADWSKQGSNTRSFSHLATVSASTKRAPALSGGKRGDATAKLIGLKCTPLDPVSAEIQKRVALDTPMELLQTFLTDGDGFVHLVIEDVKS